MELDEHLRFLRKRLSMRIRFAFAVAFTWADQGVHIFRFREYRYCSDRLGEYDICSCSGSEVVAKFVTGNVYEGSDISLE